MVEAPYFMKDGCFYNCRMVLYIWLLLLAPFYKLLMSIQLSPWQLSVYVDVYIAVVCDDVLLPVKRC